MSGISSSSTGVRNVVDIGNGASASGSSSQPVRPLRAMLARGAACDTCRTRKVKCDGQKPCAQCVKSSRGNPSLINCIYESSAPTKSNPKKRSAPSASSTDGDSNALLSDLRVDQDGDPGMIAAPEERPRPKKRQSTGSVNRVDALVERINELERRLRLQSQPMPAAVHTHPRQSASPPFYPQSFLTPGTASPGASLRRSFSVGEPIERPEVTQYTPESSIRMTGIQLGEPPSEDPFQPLQAAAAAYAAPFNATIGYVQQESSGQQAFSSNGSAHQRYSNGLGLQTNGAPLQPMPMLSGMKSVGTNAQQTSYADPVFFSSSEAPFVGTTPATNEESPPSLDASLLQLLYPGWPSSLPSPGKVQHLVNTFFNKARIPSAMISRPRFMLALDRAPLEPAFPETALIHAMCAWAATQLTEDAMLDSGQSYWQDASSPREFHYKHAMQGIQSIFSVAGRKKQEIDLLQLMQACIVMSFVAYSIAKSQDLWLLSGMAMRLCTPLRLNHVLPWDFTKNKQAPDIFDWSASHRINARRRHFLSPSADLEEQTERERTFWMAFVIDRHATTATEFSSSLDDSDITTHLPTRSPAPLDAISPQSDSFVRSYHPALGSFGQYVKATFLLGRVASFLQRSPHKVLRMLSRSANSPSVSTSADSASPNGAVLPKCADMRDVLLQSSEFQMLDRALSDFRSTTSINFIDADNRIDGHLVSAYIIPHVAQILLLEPFVRADELEETQPLSRSAVSARCIMSAGATILSTSSDLAALDPFLAFGWGVAARALIRDGAVKKRIGDTIGARTSLGLAEVVHHFAKRQASVRVGLEMLSVVTSQISALLDNPDHLMPPTKADLDAHDSVMEAHPSFASQGSLAIPIPQSYGVQVQADWISPSTNGSNGSVPSAM